MPIASKARRAAGKALLSLEVVFVVATVLGSILATAPAALATAVNGSGTMTLAVNGGNNNITAGSTGNSLVFTFTAGSNSGDNYPTSSTLTITVPSGWTAPQTSSGSASAG